MHTPNSSNFNFTAYGQAIAQAEMEAVRALIPRINQDFSRCCQLILESHGRLIVIGMGKSGHIGRKIAATLASTGTPAFFIHPGEASHGDLGMITRQDIILMLSNSGETAELLNIIPFIKQQSIPIIAMTGNPASTLAQEASHHLDISVEREAGAHGLAPTSSSTVTLVMGDALAMTLLEARGFSAEDFALFHPAGALGKKLTLKVSDLMHKDQEIPQVSPDITISNALVEITNKRLGMTLVTENKKVIGVFTDGDLRRSLDSTHDIFNTYVKDAMSTHYYHVDADALASTAIELMRQHKITTLVVMQDQQLAGVLHMHDLLRAGIN
jgi:arabinose-5-phosphate isomerase